MNFFQNSVLNKHFKAQDSSVIKAAYIKFTAHFHNPAIQENIRNSKEEQYQGEFLIDLFVNIFGYTKNPNPGFNLTTEYKNVKDSKKADGAILLRGHLAREHAPSPNNSHAPSPNAHNAKVIAVIELKGTNTTDLNRIETQAFGYKNNQPECVYVITSNFEKLRFYIDNAIDHIEFNLFTLAEKEFELLWLCLAYVNIEKNLAKRIKDESVSQEDVITKSLYNDYSLFKRELHQNLVSLNPDNDPLTLFKKSQKLLDRFLFLFFAEDRQLLPPNSVRLILDDWRDLQDRDVQIPLYDRFKKYFEYLNTGFKGKRYDVFAYNGGLFKTDELLDALKIEDELLYRHAMKLSTYDFVSEVDVNILGHIFENSLNELDEIKAQLEGQRVDKSKSKRKKDGVFYTPKYITKYIVDNTVGKLCTEKKAEIQLIEEEYFTDRKRTNKTKQPLFDKLTTYRNWLLQLTICDPACGSGAFLNQALDFLINEHRYIDELQAKLFGDAMVLGDFEKNILENNLFGVDINEESVEIAKLSLWLRTAQPNRKLNDLNNNIKCGNSLIDNPAVAGDKAFNWQEEFPTVFPEKAKKAWHITTATHNSRYSQRMIDYHVQVGDPVWLSEKEEIIVTETIAKIIIEDKLNVMAYNICGDHIHIVMACEDEELQSIMQKIKSMSARACNIAMGRTIPNANHNPAMEHAPSLDDNTRKSRGTTQFHLWTQKFGCKEIVTEEQLNNTIAYVQNNRIKHTLSKAMEHAPSPMDNANAAKAAKAVNAVKGVNAAYTANAANGTGACSSAIVATAINTITTTFTCSVSHALRTEYKGGFDVVIGNPPYVQSTALDEKTKEAIYKKYLSAQYQINTYGIFIEKTIDLLKNIGIYGLIIPNYWISTKFDSILRNTIFNENHALELINLYQVFEDANVDTLIITGMKTIIPTFPKEIMIKAINNQFKTIDERLNALNLGIWEYSEILSVSEIDQIVKISFQKSINLNGKRLISEILDGYQGMKPYEQGKGIPVQTREMMDNKVYHSDTKKDDTYFSLIGAGNVQRYSLRINDSFIKYGKNLAAPRKIEIFSSPRILVNRILSKEKIDCVFVTDVIINNTDVFNLINNGNSNINLIAILAIMGSKLCAFHFKATNVNLDRTAFPKLNVNDILSFPLPDSLFIADQQCLVEKASMMQFYNTDLQEVSAKFQRSIQRKFNLEDLPGKLQNWYLLTYAGFIKELAKKKVKLSLSEEAEWETYFLQEAKQALALKSEINNTDKEIDRMVYELYGLTEEEISIVEGE